MNITLVMYKANGADYCMGCLMGESDSDFEIFHPIDMTALIEEYAEKRTENRTARYEDEPWEFTILFDGLEADREGYLDIVHNIEVEAEIISTRKLKEIKDVAEAKEKQDKRNIKAAKTRAEKKKLKALQEKYPNS